MSAFLKSAKKRIDNKNATIADSGIYSDVSGFINTGSLLLNALFSGSIFKGLPDNKITMVAGPEGVGKSFMLLSIISSFLKEYPEGNVVIFESESAIQTSTLTDFKIDLNRLLFVPIATVQELRTQALQILDEYEKLPEDRRKVERLFLCLDSLGNLSTSKEMEDSLSGKETLDMTRAKMIKSVFRTMAIQLGLLKVPFFCTNHIYMSQSLFPSAIASGGSGTKYAASTIVFLSKKKEKEGTVHLGNIVHCKLDKSRFTKEGSQVDLLINFSSGLDPYWGVLDYLIEAGVVKQVGTRYEFPSGVKVFRKEVRAHPEQYFTPELLNSLDSYLGKKFLYGCVLENQDLSEDDPSDEESDL